MNGSTESEQNHMKQTEDEQELKLSYDEWITLKKSIWDFLERVMKGDKYGGETEILPQMTQIYLDLFRG